MLQYHFNFQGEKYLVLKKKYRNQVGVQSPGMNVASPVSSSASLDSLSSMAPTSMIPSDNFSASGESLDALSPSRQPPPYRSPPPPGGSPTYQSPTPPAMVSSEFGIPSPTLRQGNELEREKEPSVIVRSPSRDDLLNRSMEVIEETVIHTPPPVPPRRKSSDRLKLENKENVADATVKRPKMIGAELSNKMVSQ